MIKLIFLSMFAVSCFTNQAVDNKEEETQIIYPETRTVIAQDNYHGTLVDDPYRWLEDIDSDEVLTWAHAQQEVTQDYLNKIQFTDKIENRLKERWDYPRMSTPFHRDDRYFFYRNTGLQNHSVLYYRDGLHGEEKLVIDPNTLSEDGSASMSSMSISKDGKLLVYGVSQSGSDWKEFYVLNIDTQEKYPDHLKWIKFSSASWLPDGSGFYYGRYPEPEEGNEFEDQNHFNKLYFHKIGTDQSEDVLVYEDNEHPDYGFYSWITDDEKYQILGVWSGANDNNLLYYRKFKTEGTFFPIIDEWIGDFGIIHNVDTTFYVRTKHNSPKGRIMKMSINNPDMSTWVDVIPEQDKILHSSRVVNTNQFLLTYKNHLIHELSLHSINGEFIKDIKLPSLGSAGVSANWDDSEIFFSFTSFLYPRTIFSMDLTTGKYEKYWEADIDFDNSKYMVDQIFYPSTDGTQIPMFIIHSKKLQKDGLNPTYLYGYGGFNAGLSPYFSLSRLAWIEAGGIIALPGLRGGSEYGEEWHKGGMLANKQNVFDDFISAAHYLFERAYTSPKKLAIGGGSNGGLLVSACALQKPDLFRVVDCGVPVTDMLRYHKFTIGWAWVPEYGSSDDPEQFEFLYKYSPVHNVRFGTKYPSMIISTADHDDRVVPLHSYKLAAELQAKQGADNPILLQVYGKSGHGAGKPTSQVIREIAEKWAFILYEMDETYTVK